MKLLVLVQIWRQTEPWLTVLFQFECIKFKAQLFWSTCKETFDRTKKNSCQRLAKRKKTGFRCFGSHFTIHWTIVLIIDRNVLTRKWIISAHKTLLASKFSPTSDNLNVIIKLSHVHSGDSRLVIKIHKCCILSGRCIIDQLKLSEGRK